MKYLAMVVLAMVVGCSASPQHKLDLTVRNKTSKTLKLRASSFIFSQSVTLKPGESWQGWYDRRFMGKDATFEVSEVDE